MTLPLPLAMTPRSASDFKRGLQVLSTIVISILIGLVFNLAPVPLVGAHAHAAQTRSIHGLIEFGNLPSPLAPTLSLTAPYNWVSEIRVRPLTAGGLSEQTYPLHTSIAIRSALSNLSRGDYVVLTAQYMDSDFDGRMDTLAVSGIESVGLQKLLGTWRNTSWDIFRFQDYNRLELYRPATERSRAETLHLRKLKVLNYTLAPEARGSFSVLMVETVNSSLATNGRTKPVFAGRIELRSATDVQLDVFDPASGKTIESHSLTQLEITK